MTPTLSRSAAALLCALAASPGLAACAGAPAFGLLSGLGGEAPKLADLCVDRETGSISGAMTLEGYTLTRDDGVSATWENLSGGRGQFQIAPVITATYHNADVDDQSPELNVVAGGAFFRGFLYGALAAPTDLAERFLVHLGGGIEVPGGTPLGFQGEATFVDGQARISIADNAGYGTAKGTEGEIVLSLDADGLVSGAGRISTQNSRLAGHSANEWTQMDITIEALRGYATGPTGQVVKSYALVTARGTDIDGDAFETEGAFEVFLFDPNLWE